MWHGGAAASTVLAAAMVGSLNAGFARFPLQVLTLLPTVQRHVC